MEDDERRLGHLKEDKKDLQKEKGWDTVAAKLWWWMAELSKERKTSGFTKPEQKKEEQTKKEDWGLNLNKQKGFQKEGENTRLGVWQMSEIKNNNVLNQN
jgi:hypothetical protein